MSSRLVSNPGKLHTLRNHASAKLYTGHDVMSSVENRSPTKDTDMWVLCEGDDVLTTQVIERHAAWSKTQQVASRSTLPFKDQGFMPGPKAVDGRNEVESHKDIFRATLSDIAATSRQEVGEPPSCKCGQLAQAAKMRKGVAAGRSFWRCASHTCNFFEFVDRSSTIAALELEWKTLGPPEWFVVGDEGFRPEDLRQGAVGDCWFMSALAVVAERHDLLEKLLPGLNEGLNSGCHEVRLFLDGRWTAALIDSYFALAAPNKQKRQDETGLAFGRASGHQLWVPLLEKAYARAHGSYSSISGGQVSEAMLDLTGCPTESVNFKLPGFDKELFWGRLLSFLHAGFPIGCGTNADTVEELGLVGQHAYSVLDASENCSTRLVKVRNPWGEWTRREYDEILQSLGAAITSDGAFWMPYDDFIRGFAGAEVCKAHSGWHARSFEVGFAPNTETGFRKVLHLQALTRTECYIMVIQPTDRGAKLTRSNDYVLNDANFALLTADTGALEFMQFGGACRDVIGGSFFLEPGQKYTIVPFSFRARAGGCVLRVFSSNPLKACVEDAQAMSASLLWTAMHNFSRQNFDVLACRVQRMVHRVFSEASGRQVGCLILLEGEAVAVGIMINALVHEPLHITLVLEASEMIARSAGGISAGSSRQNNLRSGRSSKGKSKGRKEPTEDWHEFAILDVVPPASQQLIFAMIPSTRKKSNFDLSIVEMCAQEMPPGDHRDEERALHHPFSPRPAKAPTMDMLPGSAEVGLLCEIAGSEHTEEDLLAALSASLGEISKETTKVGQEADEDPEMELAIALSLEDNCSVSLKKDDYSIAMKSEIECPSSSSIAHDMDQNGQHGVQNHSESRNTKPMRRWNRHRMIGQ